MSTDIINGRSARAKSAGLSKPGSRSDHRDQLRALRAAVNVARPPRVARRCGYRNRSMVDKWVEDERPNPLQLLTATMDAALDESTDDLYDALAPLYYLARRFGFELVAIDSETRASGKLAIVDGESRVLQAIGDYCTTINEGIADNRLTGDEIASILRGGDRAIDMIRASMGQCAGGMPT